MSQDRNVLQSSAASLLQMRSRLLLATAFVLAVANGVFLYGLPHLAEAHYAWPIKPPINASFLGAGYVAGMVTAGLGIFIGRHWRSFRALIVPFAILGLGMLIPTILHADRFKWDYSLTWVWTIVYAGIPVGAALVWFWQESAAPAPPVREGGRPLIRGLYGLTGGALALGALALYVWPTSFLEFWPWLITPLLGRLFAAWYLFFGAILISLAWTARRAHEELLPLLTVCVWSALLLTLPALHASSVERSTTLTIWILAHVYLMVFTASAMLGARRRMRAGEQTL